jgi:hypothetical protein
MRIRQRLLDTVALVAVAGCQTIIEPAPQPASVAVQRDTLVATLSSAGGVEWMHFTIPVAIYNSSVQTLSFNYCASSIDAPVGGGWTTVWSPICALSTTATTDILPGQTRQLTLAIDAAISGPGGPAWQSANVNGVYRLAVGFNPASMSVTMPKISSNTFTLLKGS